VRTIVIGSRSAIHPDATAVPHSGSRDLADPRPGVAVFQLTNRAAEALAETREKSGLGDRIAIRISPSQVDGTPSRGYQLRFAADPLPEDVVVESGGATIFLAAGVADRLSSSVLDAEELASGHKLVLKHRPLT
jgi:Fe-S cluster assembly iron-binding protein IscA